MYVKPCREQVLPFNLVILRDVAKRLPLSYAPKWGCPLEKSWKLLATHSQITQKIWHLWGKIFNPLAKIQGTIFDKTFYMAKQTKCRLFSITKEIIKITKAKKKLPIYLCFNRTVSHNQNSYIFSYVQLLFQ
jgi:hypothetical protein